MTDRLHPESGLAPAGARAWRGEPVEFADFSRGQGGRLVSGCAESAGDAEPAVVGLGRVLLILATLLGVVLWVLLETFLPG